VCDSKSASEGDQRRRGSDEGKYNNHKYIGRIEVKYHGLIDRSAGSGWKL
jgi:hypothetical protein